jgi:hypothetical protein
MDVKKDSNMINRREIILEDYFSDHKAKNIPIKDISI